MENTGILLYQEKVHYYSCFLNFYPRIDFLQVLKLLPDNKSVNIENAFIETGLGQTYEAYEEKHLSIVRTVLDLKNSLNSLSRNGEEPFIQKLNFGLGSNIFFQVFEDFDIEIKYQDEEGEMVIKDILSVLFKSKEKIDKILQEVKRYQGKYIETILMEK